MAFILKRPGQEGGWIVLAAAQVVDRWPEVRYGLLLLAREPCLVANLPDVASTHKASP